MKSSFTISGIKHVIQLLNQYPQLMNLASLAPLREVGRKAREAVNRTGCNCTASQVYGSHARVFEQALEAMANGDHITIKNVLKVEQLCYYVKTSKGNELKCI